MRVDFHTHSNASDGTLSPTELAEAGMKAGLVAMALTDHDNCTGVREFQVAGEAAPGVGSRPVRLFAGIELSVEAGPYFDKFHLLGLGIDPRSSAMRTATYWRVRISRDGWLSADALRRSPRPSRSISCRTRRWRRAVTRSGSILRRRSRSD